MNKKWWTYFFSLSLLLVGSLFYIQRHSSRYLLPNVGYAKYFQRNKGALAKQFHTKIAEKIPEWMETQLKKDVDISQVSLHALASTQSLIKERGITSTNRYRIVNNKLYKFYDPEIFSIQDQWADWDKESFTRFENGLLTLLALTRLPDIDFIVNHSDVTSRPFHLANSPELQAPIFGWSKTKTVPHHILIPDYRTLSFWWHDDIRSVKEGKNFKNAITPWENKLDAAFWRGTLTNTTSRVKISSLSLENPLVLNAGITNLEEGDPKMKPHASIEEHLLYKYLPVLDGTTCPTPGFQWRLLSNSVVFKQDSDDIQWFYQALTPFVHYIPVEHDLSDLMTKISWAKEHEDECRKIIMNSNQFANSYLMFDDVYVYLYHAFVTYSRLQDESLLKSFAETSRSPEWHDVLVN